MTIPAMFDRISSQHGDREALISVHQATRLTYSALHDLVEKTAANLLDLGLEYGDRVGIWSPNSWEWVVMQFATARAGLILVNINPAYKAKELQHALNKVQCKALVMAPSFKTSDFIKTLREIEPPQHLKHIVCTDQQHRDGMLRFVGEGGEGGEGGGKCGKGRDREGLRETQPEPEPEPEALDPSRKCVGK